MPESSDDPPSPVPQPPTLALPPAAATTDVPTLPPSAPTGAAPDGWPADPATVPPAEPTLPTASRGPEPPGYEILGELGRGGMGVVYRARQVPLNRLVALKMILSGEHAGPEDLARFRTEAQAIARLQHPHIVQIHEVGEHDGRPFFSLEFCPGGSLERKLAGTPLPPAEAAALVETLARAMHAAHQHGVVHRDLKPANVLLAEDGTPKITDFGLAKKLDDAGQTASGAIMGTPSYMAPEQAGGQTREVGPATDIYALGATLYELLTGRPPFKAATPLDTVLQVLHDEPVPPRQMQPKVPRDLETIGLKCLQKEPARRYGSAAELADDLRRFLDGRAITARPVGRVERAWRWCRRNPAVAGLAAAVVVALLCGTGAATYFAVQARAGERQALAEKERADEEAAAARRQENLAQEQRQRAETSYRLAREGLEECVRQVRSDPRLQRGELEDLRRTVLQAEVQFYQKFLELRGDDPAFQRERGQAFLHLGWLTMELGGKEEAVRHYRQGLAVFADLVRDHPDTPEYRAWLARGSNDLGVLYDHFGQRDEAERLLREAIAVQEALVRDWPKVDAARFDLAKHRGNLGRIYRDRGRLDQAEPELRTALNLYQALVQDHPREPEYRACLAVAYNNLALLCGARQQPAETERLLREALGLHQALARAYPEVASYRDELALTYRELGDVVGTTGRSREAEQMYGEALALQKALVRDHPALPAYRANLSATYDTLAQFLRDRGRPAEAEEAFQETVRLEEALHRDYPTVREHALHLGGAQCNLANLVRDSGRPADSLTWYARAVTTLGAVLAREPRQAMARRFLRNAHWGRADALTRLGRHAEALKDWERAAELEGGPQRGWFRLQRALALARLKEHARAAAEADELAWAQDAAPGTLYDLACVFALSAASAGDDPKQTESYAARAVELLRQAVAKGYQDIAHLKNDPDLKTLRMRDDFRQLLRSLEAKR
jgi:serine/threonine-protein kinase